MNQTKDFSWWIKILTDNPLYIYYFGEFKHYWEAEACKNGYIQDLKEEKAKIVDVGIGKYEPEETTVSVVIEPKSLSM